MRQCNDYEIELSALLDGESDPATALTLVEHVASCSACGSFVRELRSTQDLVDQIAVETETEPESTVVVPIEQKRRRLLGLRPQWAVGFAAAAILIVSLWFGSDLEPQAGLNDLRDGELVIRLEEDKGRMSDERFIAMVSELLRADRRYQSEMYAVLDEITQQPTSGESRFTDDSYRSGENNTAGRPESASLPTAAME